MYACRDLASCRIHREPGTDWSSLEYMSRLAGGLQLSMNIFRLDSRLDIPFGTLELIGYVRHINILTRLRGFQDKLPYLVVFVSKFLLGIERQKKL